MSKDDRYQRYRQHPLYPLSIVGAATFVVLMTVFAVTDPHDFVDMAHDLGYDVDFLLTHGLKIALGAGALFVLVKYILPAYKSLKEGHDKRWQAAVITEEDHVIINTAKLPHYHIETIKEIHQTIHEQPAALLPETQPGLYHAPPVAQLYKDFERLARRNLELPPEKREIIFGFEQDGQPLKGPYLAWFRSGLIGGMNGTGKTHTARYFAGQIPLLDGMLDVYDPHGISEEGLLVAMAPYGECYYHRSPWDYDDPYQAVDYLRELYAEWSDRRSRTNSRLPIIVPMFDEFEELISQMPNSRLRAEVIGILSDLTREGRKFGVAPLYITQTWNLAETGGSTIRPNVTGRVLHDAERGQAATILNCNDPEQLKKILNPPLALGEIGIRLLTQGYKRLHIPYMTPEDCLVMVEIAREMREYRQPYQGFREAQDTSPIWQGETPQPFFNGLMEPLAPNPDYDPDYNIVDSHLAEPRARTVPLRDTPKEPPIDAKSRRMQIRYQQKRARLIEVGTRLMEQHQCVKRTRLRDDAGIHGQDYWMVVKICEEMGWPGTPPPSIAEEDWEALKAEYGYRCANPDCDAREPGIILEKDHVIPIQHGGENHISNIQPLCPTCNNKDKKQKHTDYRQACKQRQEEIDV